MEEIKQLKLFSYMVIPPILAFTGLSKEIIVILGFLIALDVVTGIIRELTLKTSRFRSKVLWIGIASKGLLMLIPLLLVLAGKGIGMNLLPIAQVSLSILILAETYSVLGNIVQIRKADTTIDEQDAITLLIKSIEISLKQLINTLLSQVNNREK